MRKTNKKEPGNGEAVEALPKNAYRISMAWEVN
jgi:hypothetical protein